MASLRHGAPGVLSGHGIAPSRGGIDGCASSGYHRRSLVENLMYRLKTLTGNRLWAREVGSQATEVAIRVGVLNRMAALARPQSVRIA
ncbi:hypothetical protein D3C72_1808500 [compost metagenome]